MVEHEAINTSVSSYLTLEKVDYEAMFSLSRPRRTISGYG
jgi:hypothetical protein